MKLTNRQHYYLPNFNHNAFTLVELLIAVAIAAMAFFPILNMFTTSMRDSYRLSHYAHARELAAKSMDELLSIDYASLPEGTSIPISSGVQLPRTENSRNMAFRITLLIEKLKPTFHVRHRNLAGFLSDPIAYPVKDDELKRITVTVTWRGVSSDQNFTLQTLRSDLFI